MIIEMMNEVGLITIAVLLISNTFYAIQYYKRKRRKRMEYLRMKEHYNVTSATSKANYHTIRAIETKWHNAFESIENRLDKLEVDSAYIKNFTIKSEDLKKESKIIPDPTEIEKKPLFFSNALKNKKHKSSKLFTEKEIDTEIRIHLGEILFLTPSEHKEEYHKAYGRLYYKHKTKNK
tara:strand:- start:7471 stop:8004 length:534 start_codon:yes stop_codon:yes gene_type:complete